jgi:hypothetical protein
MPRSQAPSGHASHDLYMIAAALDRDVSEAIRDAAAGLVADCEECARLDADLRSIGAGLDALPRALPVARDYRLTPEQARRVRARGWRRILATFGPGGMPSVRPLASALTTLGLAGLLFTAVLPAAFSGSAGSAGAPAAVSNGQAGGTGGPAAEQGTGTKAVSGPAGTVPPPGVDVGATTVPTPAPERNVETPQPTQAFAVDSGGRITEPAAPSRPSPLVIVSIVLLATGVALFGLRLAALRLE